MTSPSNGKPAAEEVSNCKPSRKNIPLPTFSQAVALALVNGNIDGRTRNNVAGENDSFCLTIYPKVLDSMWRRGGLEASMVADNILTDAAKIIRQVYPSVAATDSDVMMKSLTWS